jgi:hypothetical protein
LVLVISSASITAAGGSSTDAFIIAIAAGAVSGVGLLTCTGEVVSVAQPTGGLTRTWTLHIVDAGRMVLSPARGRLDAAAAVMRFGGASLAARGTMRGAARVVVHGRGAMAGEGALRARAYNTTWGRWT